MVARIRLLVLLFALAEIAGFILVGRAIGLAGTLGLVLLGCVAGGMLLRHQGSGTLARLRSDVAARRVPADTVADGILKAAAAILLFVPGFFSDVFGLLLLVPAIRRQVRHYGASRLAAAPAGSVGPRGRPQVIDLAAGEFRSTNPDRPPPDYP